ncbi:MAG: histidine ammonia-lyase, partial [Mesorhizobium sp.]
MTPLVLTGAGVSIEDVAAVARSAGKVEITLAVIEKLGKARQVLDDAAAGGQQIYGLNTG